MSSPEPESLRQTAARLGMSPGSARKLIRKGILPFKMRLTPRGPQYVITFADQCELTLARTATHTWEGEGGALPPDRRIKTNDQRPQA